MAVPTVVAVGAAGSLAGGIVDVPAGEQANDILIWLTESQNAQAVTVPGDWAHVTGSPVIGADTRLTVLWKRSAGGELDPAIAGPVDHALVRMIAIRGCKTTGNPWNGTPGVGTEAAGNDTAEFPGQTTTANDCLVLECVATGRDAASTTNVGALTNAAYTNIVEQMDNWAAAGTGGGVGMVSATMATAGPTGQSTATLGSTDAKALMTLALEPPAAAGGSSASTNRMLLGVG